MGRRAASAQTTRQRVPWRLTTAGRPGRLEAGRAAVMIKLFSEYVVHVYSGCHSAIKEDEAVPFAATEMALEIITPREGRHRKINMALLTCGVFTKCYK